MFLSALRTAGDGRITHCLIVNSLIMKRVAFAIGVFTVISCFKAFCIWISSGSEWDNKNLELWHQHSQTHFFYSIWRKKCLKTICKITVYFPSDFSVKYFNQNRTYVASCRNKACHFLPSLPLTTHMFPHREIWAKLLHQTFVPKTAKVHCRVWKNIIFG